MAILFLILIIEVVSEIVTEDGRLKLHCYSKFNLSH